jgi:hypothetical protein
VTPDDAQFLYLQSVSWPMPVASANGRWLSDPVWDAPPMSTLPRWQFRFHDPSSLECFAWRARASQYTLDWADLFRFDLNRSGQPSAGEMRGFHLVFRLRVQRGGTMAFFDTDGCIIRRNHEIVHEDREAHPLRNHELPVEYGDHLEVAQWQSGGPWTWGARWEAGRAAPDDMLVSLLAPYGRRVEDALARPNGPPLKIYTNGTDPVRCALGIYSMALNGYRPAGIQVFGEHQWNQSSRRVLTTLLPFADIVDTGRVERTLDALNPCLVPLARSSWGAMKICIGLFVPPYEYCFLDDDIFVLDRIDDALRLHEDHTLVYAVDMDRGRRHRAIWCPEDAERPLLGEVSTGFYLIRNNTDLKRQSDRLLKTRPGEGGHPAWMWEQGFFAWEFGETKTAMLPTQRYFCPVFDGLPGGLLGYDWSRNPCGFTFVHFGGPKPKPGDDHAGGLVHEILGRHRAKA